MTCAQHPFTLGLASRSKASDGLPCGDKLYMASPAYSAACRPIAGGIKEQSWDENLRELTAKLGASRAKWKVVVGHHPVRYSSSYALTTELLDSLEPVLEQYRVDAYFSGAGLCCCILSGFAVRWQMLWNRSSHVPLRRWHNVK